MAVVALPHAPASVSLARRQLVAYLRGQGVCAETIADAELVLAEMVGNAVRHGKPLPGGTVRAAWEVVDGQVLLRVTDGGASTRPVIPQQIDVVEAERGRGLAIVAAVAKDWGAQRDGGGLRTWAILDLIS